MLEIFQMQERMETKHVLPGWGTYFHPIHEDVRFQRVKMYLSGLKPISSNLYGIMKSQEEGRKNVGRETLWRRKMKQLWTESVLYFHMCVWGLGP